ncbi:hypothetical protein H8D36_02575 [archaeon]|nr:hypothetical protein [archaeon]MBL7057557.1 hypothetical protein [Candidatus Woesearchaeota archaeon]
MKKECATWIGWLFLLFGIIYLVADLVSGWNFWGINWWTIALLLLGLHKISK